MYMKEMKIIMFKLGYVLDFEIEKVKTFLEEEVLSGNADPKLKALNRVWNFPKLQ